MSIEKITARILQEAKDEALIMQNEALAQKEEMLKIAAQKAEQIETDLSKKALEDGKILVERRHAVAELEARKEKLSVKQEILETVFDEAKQEILSMDTKAYLQMILSYLEPYRKSEGQIMMNAFDHERLKEPLMEALKDTKLILSEESAKIEGGFLLQQGNIYVNASLEKIFESEKKQMIGKVAGILFE